ncbi:MAG: serine/threonine-protein kinase, partial [Stackebrandtia sp.]
MGGLGPNNPRQIGDFDILGVVHSDAISVTYAALGPAGQRVAVTQIRSPYSEDDGVRSAFRDETAAREQLSDARIAPVVDAAPEADHPWIVRERPFGTSLRKIIDTIGPLPAPVVLRLAAELAEALAEMHQRGMLHRDLSPSNVLISPDGVRLIDFGAASGPVDGPLVLGTPGYLAPEQIIGRPAVPAGDVFSLGSVMLMAATGRDPFEASDHAVTLYKVLNEEVDLTDLPTTLRTIVERALAK